MGLFSGIWRLDNPINCKKEMSGKCFKSNIAGLDVSFAFPSCPETYSSIDYARRGIGSIMLQHAMTLTQQRNAKYLRLFVVDINKPAIQLYLKNGFRQVEGVYNQRIDDALILREYGFEKAVQAEA